LWRPAASATNDAGKSNLAEEIMIKLLMVLAATCFVAGGAAAETCKAQSETKKLHGAAETSFMTKCEKDAKTKCDADAKAKNLHGAAETSFTTKCVKDATGV
jgi:hypothetical protein